MGLKVNIGGDGTGFANALNKSEKDALNFGQNIGKGIAGNLTSAVTGAIPGLTASIAGIFASDKIKESLNEFSARGKDIKVGSWRLNVDKETFERIDNVMKAIGKDASSAEGAFDHLAVAVTKIEDGDKEASKLVKSLSRLGVVSDDILNKDYRKMFFGIMDNLKDSEITEEKIKSLRDIFGRGGVDMIPAAKIGFDSKTANAGILSKTDLATIESYNSEMRNLKAQSAGLFNSMKSGALAVTSGLSGLFDLDVLNNMFSGKNMATEMWENRKMLEFFNAQKAKLAEITEEKERQKVLDSAAIAKGQKDSGKEMAADAKEAARITEEALKQEEENRLASLSTEEKKTELLKKRAEIVKNINEADEPSPLDVAKANLALVKIDAELNKIKDPKGHAMRIVHGAGSLAEIGGMLGSGREVMTETNGILRDIHKAVLASKPSIPETGR